MAFDPKQFTAKELSLIVDQLDANELQSTLDFLDSKANPLTQFGTAFLQGTQGTIAGYPGAVRMGAEVLGSKPGQAITTQDIMGLAPTSPAGTMGGAFNIASKLMPSQFGTGMKDIAKGAGAVEKFISQPIPGLTPNKYDFADRPFMEISRILGGAAPSLIATYGGAGALKAAGMAPQLAALAAGGLSQLPQSAVQSYDEQIAKDIDPTEAAKKAVGVATVISLIESVPASKWLEGYGGTSRVIKVVKGAITEGSEEVVQAGVTLADRLTRASSQEEVDQALLQFSQEAKEGAVGGIGLGGGAGAVSPFSQSEVETELRKRTERRILNKTTTVDFFGEPREITTADPAYIEKRVQRARRLFGLEVEGADKPGAQGTFDFVKSADTAIRQQVELLQLAEVVDEREIVDLLADKGKSKVMREIVNSMESGFIDKAGAVQQVIAMLGGSLVSPGESEYISKQLDARTAKEAVLARLKDALGKTELLPGERADYEKNVARLEKELSVPAMYRKLTVEGKDIIVPTMSSTLAKAYYAAMQLGQHSKVEKIVERFRANPNFIDQKTGTIKRLLTAEDLKVVGDIAARDFGVAGPVMYIAVKFKNITDLKKGFGLTLGWTYPRSGASLSRTIHPAGTKYVPAGKALEMTYIDPTTGRQVTKANPTARNRIIVPAGVRPVIIHTFEEGPAATDAQFFVGGQPRALTFNAGDIKRGNISNVYDTLVHEIAHETYGHGRDQDRFLRDLKRARTALFVKITKVIASGTPVAVEYYDPVSGTKQTKVTYGDDILKTLKEVGENLIRLGVVDKSKQQKFVFGDVVSRPEDVWKNVTEEIPFTVEDEMGQQVFAFGGAAIQKVDPVAPTAPVVEKRNQVYGDSTGQGDLFEGNQQAPAGPPLPPAPPPPRTPSVPPIPPVPRMGPGGKIIPMNLNPVDLEHMKYIGDIFAWGSNNGRDFQQVWEQYIGTQFRTNPAFKRFLGVYYSHLGPNGRISVKDIMGLRTMAHEVGHFVDDYYAKSRGLIKVPRQWNNAIRQELVAISTARRGPMDQHDTYRNSRSELVADFYCTYVLDEQQARLLAPQFFSTVIDPLIASNPEFTYIAVVLREIQKQLGEVGAFADTLTKVKQFNVGPILDQTQKHHGWGWLEAVGYSWENRKRAYKSFTRWFDNVMNSNDITKMFTEKGGLTDPEFNFFSQFHKLIAGNMATVKEDLTEQLAKNSPEVQQKIAETLQDFKARYGDDPNHPLWALTEKTRYELARWANAIREIGLLNDMVFWNNVGRYFPYMYTEKELKATSISPYTKKIQETIRANTSWAKRRMTNVNFAQEGSALMFREDPLMLGRLLHSLWPERYTELEPYFTMDANLVSPGAIREVLNSVAETTPLTKDDLELLGMRMRENMGLIKTAAYPVHKRLGQMIKTYYRVKLCDSLANIPGVKTGSQLHQENAVKMPKTKTNGGLAGEWVRKDVYNALQGFDQSVDQLTEYVQAANAVWKTMKVPLNPGSYVTNNMTNLIMMWMHDIPVFTSPVVWKGVQAFRAQGRVYKALREAGLYNHTYGSEELAALSAIADKHKGNISVMWAKIAELMDKPGKAYGFFEDMGKTIIANHYLEKGASIEEAVRAADKILFDYSSTSRAVQIGKKSFLPFVTWSAKVAPRLVEQAFMRPEKYVTMMGILMAINMITKALFNVDDDEEKDKKPSYMKGNPTLIVGRDSQGNPLFLDLSKYMPWGTWDFFDEDGLKIPGALSPGGMPISLLSAFVFNRDPFTGKDITAKWMTPQQATKAKWDYLGNSIAPEWLGGGKEKILAAVKGVGPRPGDKPDSIGLAFAKSIGGLRINKTTAVTRKSGRNYAKRILSEGVSALKKQYVTGKIDKAAYEKQVKSLYKMYQDNIQ